MKKMKKKTVSIKLYPSGKLISNIRWTSRMDVQMALERAYGVQPGIKFALQYYGKKLGYLVLMIDGVSDSSTEFWFLKVGPKYSKKGIDSTILKSGAKVEFVYEPYDAKKHVGAIHQARVQ
jgi:hypothetical protein